MPPKAAHCGRGGALKRCEYFIKCCNCKQVFAARDFAEHTGEFALHSEQQAMFSFT